MLVKIMLVFLLAMVGVAMVGNFLFPGALGRKVRSRLTGPLSGRLTGRKAATCPNCGRHRIGRICDCGKDFGKKG